MIKQVIKFLIIGIFFYLIIIIQASIFYFTFPSLLLITLFILGYNLLESPSQKTGIFIALWAGLLIDIYSSTFFFGFYSIIFMAITIFLKSFISRYVRIP